MLRSHCNLVSFAAVIRVVTQRSSSQISGEERYVTTLVTATKETNCNQEFLVKKYYQVKPS